MLNLIINRDKSLSEIVPLFVGHEKCEPSHSYGPHRRNYYLIHFCLSGKGVLNDRFGSHKIKAGELFVIRKGEITTYTADEREPWEYLWIAFEGSRAQLFAKARSVYKSPAELSTRLSECIEARVQTTNIYLSLIYELIHSFFDEKNEKTDVAAAIKRYIEYNYMERITISDIALTYSFDRTYLYKLFKKKYGVGIKEYIISRRIENAKKFLRI